MTSHLIERAREERGLTQAELAEAAGTSRTTLNAYERGRKFPTAATLQRILDAAGFELTAEARPEFRSVPGSRGAEYWVSNRLWRLEPRRALRRLVMPSHLDWSASSARDVDLRDRHQRARCYEVVLREGTPGDIQSIVDGCLLVDAWNELFLPEPLRAAWSDTIESELA